MMRGTVHDPNRRQTHAVWSSTQTSDGSLERSEKRPAEQLLPGIPDEISLDLVAPKLGWRAFYVLSSVSQAWKRAIRSGQVYDARVRCEGTETLALIEQIIFGTTNAIGLYSGKDKLVHKLPPIPNVRNGIPKLSKCISLDGKVYVIGGDRGQDGDPKSSDGGYKSDRATRGLRNVYVLDLARQRPWEQRKSMGYSRVHFGLGVLGGKIYVMGGESYCCGPAVTVSEVYDPLSNTWHQFESTLNWRYHHQVSTIAEELIIHRGYISPKYEVKKVNFFPRDEDDIRSPEFLEIFHPGENSWRKVIDIDSTQTMFIHQGRIHSTGSGEIFVYDIDEKLLKVSHSYLHTDAWTRLLENEMVTLPWLEWSALVCGNEIVTIQGFWHSAKRHFVQIIFSSIGFGTQAEHIRWQIVESSFPVEKGVKLCPLQL